MPRKVSSLLEERLLEAFTGKASDATQAKREMLLKGQCSDYVAYQKTVAYIAAWDDALKAFTELARTDYTDDGDFTDDDA